jgi:hypothetical protein
MKNEITDKVELQAKETSKDVTKKLLGVTQNLNSFMRRVADNASDISDIKQLQQTYKIDFDE